MYSFAVLPISVSSPHRRAQDVAGCVVRKPEVFLQALALRSLATAGRAEEDEV